MGESKMRRIYPKPKVGDLVCYNSAGMRNHSLGLVTKAYTNCDLLGTGRTVDYLYIHWSLVPPVPPRAEWGDPRRELSVYADHIPNNNREGWYRDIGNFEVISENK